MDETSNGIGHHDGTGRRRRPRAGRRLLALVAASALWLAGHSASLAHAPEIEVPWGAQDCDFVIVIVPTDAATLAPHLPEGFTATIPESEPVPPDPRMEAVFGFEIFQCGQHTVGERVVEDGSYASVWTWVEPPAELRDPQYPLTFFKWRTMIPDDRQREMLQDLDVTVAAGDGDMAGAVVTPAGATFDVGFTLVPTGATYRISGAATAPAEFGGSFVEHSHLDGSDRFAAWRSDFGAAEIFSGAAVARWDENALAAEVLGTTEAEAWVLAGSGLALTDASIHVPRDRGPDSAAGRHGGPETNGGPGTPIGAVPRH